MRDPADAVTGELPGLPSFAELSARYPDACPACADGVQPGRSCARCGRIEQRGLPSFRELLAKRDELQHKIDHPGRGRKPGQRVGAYRGAVKIGCINHALRAKTGKSQAEFAKLAGISERTLRTWEAGGREAHLAMSAPVRASIVGALSSLGVFYLAEVDARTARRPVRYRCKMTGATWSGRGLMPKWLKVALERGATLADFAK